MRILAIDTSCDDTCISILEAKNRKAKVRSLKVLSDIVSSQVEIHKKHGGVVPGLAKREHQKNLIPVLKRSLKKIKDLKRKIFIQEISVSERRTFKNLLRENNFYQDTKSLLGKYRKPKLALIAVTQGPGLEPALWTGLNFARAISYFWKVPIVPVNHIEAHIFANLIKKGYKCQPLNLQSFLPAVCLVVSGGHTELILMKGHGDYKLIGETRDDAAGECLDKVAKILGLSYPGGPQIEKLARKGRDVFQLPRPMMYSKNYDFSFSGLKTAVFYLTKKIPTKKLKNYKLKANIAVSVQQSVIDVLISKTLKTVKEYKTKTILLGGGVIANNELRKQFQERVKKECPSSIVSYPPAKLCTDNAVMIGVSGYLASLQGGSRPWRKIKARANLRI